LLRILIERNTQIAKAKLSEDDFQGSCQIKDTAFPFNAYLTEFNSN